MPSRLPGLPLAVVVVAILSNLFLFAWEGPSSLQYPPYGTVAGTVGLFIVFLLASYEALAIRRALAVRLYRNQALGIGLVALAFVVLSAFQLSVLPFLPPNTGGPFGTPINYPFIYFTWLVLFYWIDASVRAARRSDPLLRDTLRWSQVRIVVWALVIGSIAVTSSIVLYLVVETGLSIFAQASLPFGGPGASPLNFLTFFVPIIFGAVYLPVAALRSKDPTLRRHLAWFGLGFLFFVAILFLFNSPFPEIAQLAQSEMVVSVGYFLYRSARSLVPLNRISLD